MTTKNYIHKHILPTEIINIIPQEIENIIIDMSNEMFHYEIIGKKVEECLNHLIGIPGF